MLALCHFCWTHTKELVMRRVEQLAKKKEKTLKLKKKHEQLTSLSWVKDRNESQARAKLPGGKTTWNKGDSNVMSGSLEEVIHRWTEKWRRNGSRQVKANFWCWKESFILLVSGPRFKRVFIHGVNFICSTNCTPVRDKEIIKITTMLNQLASIGILSWIGTQLN